MTKIPPETIDRVFSAARIEEIVGDYVSLKKRGANLIGLCPFHDEKTGSFTVSPSKGIYKCFGCGKSGHAVGFIMEIEQCSYVEAIKTIAKKYGIVIEERELSKEEQQVQDDRESMFVVNEWSNKWFQNQLWETPEGKAIGLSYLRERGLRDDTIHKFNIGYSPDKNLLSKDAVQQGFAEKYLVNDPDNAPYWGTGVCLKSDDGRLYDRFHSRVVFPFFSASGKVIGFAGRIMKQNDKVGKYVNSPTSPLFEKHDCLYGLFQAKQHIVRLNRCYLVEGQMDVISMYQAGIQNVVSSGGTSLTKPQIRLIHRFTDNITVLYDGDKAGIKAALRGIDMILEEGIHVKVVLLPEGEDPDSFARSHTAEAIGEYIKQHETDFIRFKTQLLNDEIGNDPIKRGETVQSVLQSIAYVRDVPIRLQYIKVCAETYGINEDTILRRVNKMIREKMESASDTSIHSLEEEKNKEKEAEEMKELMYSSAEIAHQQFNDKYDANILNILQVIVRYGERVLFVNEDGVKTLVGEYIISEMQTDSIQPRLLLHQQIIDEYMAHCQEPNFVASTFFMRHSNSAISQLAIDLVADKYQLSKGVADAEVNDMPSLVSRLLLELKYTVVNERIDELQANLTKAQNANDWGTITKLLREQPMLIEIRSQICKALGNRVIAM